MKTKKKRAAVGLAALKKLRFQAMLIRDGTHCLKCGTTQGLAPSHVFPTGRYPRMAWILDNVKPLCYFCHILWWHKAPTESGEWFKKNFPARYRKLKALSQKELPKPDLKKIKEEYLEIIDI